jgi:hypothetical protein
MKTPRLLTVLVVPLLLGAVACGDDKKKDKEKEEAEAEKALGADCGDLLKPADAAATLPADLPPAAGLTIYEKTSQGSTQVWFGHIEGDDVVKVRDAVKAQLESAGGYEGLDTDAEPPAEAELEFEGKHEGSVQVIPLCKDHLRVRYRLSN